jgi:hypothetical protein
MAQEMLRTEAGTEARIKRYRLAIYDATDENVLLDFVGKVLSDSREDRCYIREAIEEYNAYVARLPGCTYAMGLFEVGSQAR